jgi:hypothetical protein
MRNALSPDVQDYDQSAVLLPVALAGLDDRQLRALQIDHVLGERLDHHRLSGNLLPNRNLMDLARDSGREGGIWAPANSLDLSTR